MGEVSLGTRKQWVNFPGAPMTGFASATLYLEDYYTQFGLKVMTDKIGYTFTNDVDLSYAYSMYLNTTWQLNMGISLSFQNMAYDLDKISLFNGDVDDPIVFSKLMRDNNINSDIGLEFSHYEWRLGAASHNIFTLFFPINELHTNTNVAYAMYRPYTRDLLSFGYGACAIQYSNIYQMEFNVTGYYRETMQNNAFQIGAFYRTWREMGISFGVDFKKLKVLYNYDYNLGQIYRHSLGTHELILTYKFDKTYNCKNCWY